MSRRALLALSSDQSMGNPAAAIAWDTAVEDTGSFFNALEPTRLTVPAGVSAVRLYAAVDVDNASGPPAGIYLTCNGITNGKPGMPSQIIPLDNTTAYLSFASPPIAVSEGDYFECVRGFSGGMLEANDWTYFGIEAV